MADLTFIGIQSVPKPSRRAFSCGTDALDRYFRLQAKQDTKRGVAATFVLMNDQKVIGFYTLSAAEIDTGHLPEHIQARFPRYPTLPATRLGRLAVDARFQRQGWGEKLLIDAIFRAFENIRVVASIALIVDSKEESRDFYLKFGFIEFPDTRNKMFLPMDTISKVIEAGKVSGAVEAVEAPARQRQQLPGKAT